MQIKADDWAKLLALSVLWGGSFFFVAIAVKEIPPMSIVFCRVGLASLVLFAFLRITDERLPSPKHYPMFLKMGLMNNVIPFTLLFWAQMNITSGLASIMNATTPIFSIIMAHLLLADEPLRLNRFVGVIFGVIGVVVIMGIDVFEGSTAAILGMLACLGASLFYGLSSVYGRQFKQANISNTVGAFGQLTASTVVMLPLILVFDKPWQQSMPSMPAIVAVLSLAVISTAVAYVLFYSLLASVGAVNTALVTLLVPVSAVFLGTFFLGEALMLHHVLGMLCIALGLLAIDGRLLRRLGWVK